MNNVQFFDPASGALNMSISLLPSIAAAHGNVTLITEQLDSPAEFLLHRALTSVLKEGIPCILVSSWNDLMHWSTIQSRSVSSEVSPRLLMGFEGVLDFPPAFQMN